MFIKGRDRTKPVLLFVHGGPGMPAYFLNRTHPTGLEEDFVVCWWEQRGAGLSYRDKIPPQTMTVDQMVSDTIAVTDYLRQRFGKEKIYLMGHSNGSFLGIQAAARAPELYHAYIGVAQVAHQLDSENRSLEYLREEYRKRGDAAMVRKLEAIPTPMTVPLPQAWESVRDDAMHGAGVGTTRDMDSVVTGIFLNVWLNPEYTVAEKIDIGRGKKFSRSFGMWDEMHVDGPGQEGRRSCGCRPTSSTGRRLHDPYDETKAYLRGLKAPVKGFYTFERSAHSPVYEEPEKARRILREDVLTGRTGLADAD